MKSFKALLLSIFFYSFSTSPAYADLKVGTVFFYPPFVMSIGEGFDIELIQTLCQRIQENCQLIPMDFNQLFTALDSGKIDIAIGGITISKDKLAKYIFSLPYMLSKGEFLILKNNPTKSINELQGSKVGIIKGLQDGGLFYNYLLTHYDGQFQILQYDDMEDLITALNSGEITAAFTHESTTLYWTQNGGDQFKTLGNPMLVGDGIAIMALPNNAPLIQQINQQLQKMEQDNSYLNLYNTYFANER